MTALRFDVVARGVPLEPSAVIARGPAALVLAHSVLARDDAALTGLRGVAGDGLLALVAPAERLPWVDGVTYVGVDPDAPGVLWPTHSRPSVHPMLVLQALRPLLVIDGPWAVLFEDARIVPLGAAGPVDRSILARWCAEATAA